MSEKEEPGIALPEQKTETFDKYLGVVNTKRTEPILEAGGKAWWTRRGGKVIAVMYDDWNFENEVMERLPSGTVAEGPRGEVVRVP
jgi:hypothetical protein